MRLTLLLSLLLVAAPATAQVVIPVTPPPFDVGATIDLSSVAGGRAFAIWADVDPDPAVSGDVFVDFYMNDTFTIVRYHPTKHGRGGSLPGPGICAEAEVIRPAGLNWRSVGDLNGDGFADVLFYTDVTAIGQVFLGKGFVACR